MVGQDINCNTVINVLEGCCAMSITSAGTSSCCNAAVLKQAASPSAGRQQQQTTCLRHAAQQWLKKASYKALLHKPAESIKDTALQISSSAGDELDMITINEPAAPANQALAAVPRWLLAVIKKHTTNADAC
jgi:hypothetical protein